MADSSLIGREERQRKDWQQDTGSRLQGGLDTAGADQSHMADAYQGGWGWRPRDGDGERDGQAGERDEDHGVAAGGGEDRLDLADAQSGGRGQGIADARGVREGDSSQGPTGRSAQYDSASFWDNHVWLTGSDGKSRRSQPGLPLLAYGVSNRVGRLRAYGNAIVPPLAAEVIRALM